MARTKITPNPPPPRVHYNALYSWASDELLNECTNLTTVEDIENHLGDLRLYKEALEKQLASGDSSIEELERAKRELIAEREAQDSTI